MRILVYRVVKLLQSLSLVLIMGFELGHVNKTAQRPGCKKGPVNIGAMQSLKPKIRSPLRALLSADEGNLPP